MTAGKEFRWAVVGMGRHSRQYVLPGIGSSARGALAAIVTSDPDSARRFVEPWGAPRIHETFEAVLADAEVDGILLSTPNHVHHRQVLAAADAGKHVLCEKPLALSADEAAEMVHRCLAAGVVLGTGFHLRHNEVHREAREVIRSGRIGRVQYVHAHYAHRTSTPVRTGPRPAGIPPVAAWRRDPALAGGGAFVSTGSHIIDLLRFLTGLDVLDVQARADAAPSQELNLAFVAGLTGGALATVQAGELALPENEIAVSGTHGTLTCRGSVGNHGRGRLTVVTADGTQTRDPAPRDVYAAECDAFVLAVQQGRPANASGEDGLRAQEVIDAAYASAADGIRVRVTHRDVLGMEHA